MSIKVSIIVPTRNHEKYISKCLESILAQNVTFSIEILIGDDCSIDNTPFILEQYKKKYPEIIKVFKNKTNVGATRNVYDLCMQMKGEYYAYLEGDDYWCDNDKLQKQVNFLENNNKYIGCYGNVLLVDENGNRIKKNLEWISKRKRMSIKNYDGHKLPGHSSTWMRRNVFINNQEKFRFIYENNQNIGDRIAALCFLCMGPFYRINDNFSCYRYVRNIAGNNITSKVYLNSNSAEYEMDEIIRMEKYCKEVGNIKKKFTIRKFQIVCDAIIRYLKNKNEDNQRIKHDVFKKCDYKMVFVLLLPYLFIAKIIKKIIYV